MNTYTPFRAVAAFMLAALCLVIFGASTTFAQSNNRIVSTQNKEAHGENHLGRDLWFAIPMNFSPTDRATKYFNVYVNSSQNTTVHLQIGNGAIIQKTVTAGKVRTFTSPTPKNPSPEIPLGTELYSSGVVEQKAVHVWSDDADIAVYFLSRRDYTSGGTYVLPTIGWGNEYIVGSYESIFDPTGQADWPSEFAIVANQDSTVVTITPNWDIRKDGLRSTIEHAKKVPFNVILNKGECVQYQTVLPFYDGECDLTGSIITSNNPVGVMGASVDPYLPFPDGYGDYCLSMLQPIRSWSNTYFTAPFAGRKFGGDVYCVIASKKQYIYRNSVQVAVLNGKGDFYFIYDDNAASPASIWASDAPFELMQYIPSATFGTTGGTIRNQGDADMMNVNPADQYAKNILFQVPTIDLASGQTDFTNYVNIILPANHESKTTYDGVLLSSTANPPNVSKVEHLPIINTSWEAIRLTYTVGNGEGVHTVASDTGVYVYCYGYGTDDSYSWNGNLGVNTVNSPDTIPPIAATTGTCFSEHVNVTDSKASDSKLSSIIIDTIYNMSSNIDPSFIPGSGVSNSFYNLHILDSTLEAYASVFIYDIAGNRTNVVSTYKPQLVKISSSLINFGTGSVGATTSSYDTICNNGSVPYPFKATNLRLLIGNKGFVIDSIGADKDIPVGECRIFKIGFSPLNPTTAFDTVEIVDDCSTTFVAGIVGNGGLPDYTLSDEDFLCHQVDSVAKRSDVAIINVSSNPLTFDSVYVDDKIHFGFDPTAPLTNTLPFILPVSAQHHLEFSFKPDSVGNFQTLAHIHNVELGWKTAILKGCGQIPAAVSTNMYHSDISTESSEYLLISSRLESGNGLVLLPPTPNPATSLNGSIQFIYGIGSDTPIDLTIYDILGKPVATAFHTSIQRAGIYQIDFRPALSLSNGAYIYRLSGGGKVFSGKLVISR